MRVMGEAPIAIAAGATGLIFGRPVAHQPSDQALEVGRVVVRLSGSFRQLTAGGWGLGVLQSAGAQG